MNFVLHVANHQRCRLSMPGCYRPGFSFTHLPFPYHPQVSTILVRQEVNTSVSDVTHKQMPLLICCDSISVNVTLHPGKLPWHPPLLFSSSQGVSKYTFITPRDHQKVTWCTHAEHMIPSIIFNGYLLLEESGRCGAAVNLIYFACKRMIVQQLWGWWPHCTQVHRPMGHIQLMHNLLWILHQSEFYLLAPMNTRKRHTTRHVVCAHSAVLMGGLPRGTPQDRAPLLMGGYLGVPPLLGTKLISWRGYPRVPLHLGLSSYSDGGSSGYHPYLGLSSSSDGRVPPQSTSEILPCTIFRCGW